MSTTTDKPPVNGRANGTSPDATSAVPVDTYQDAAPLLRRPFTPAAVKWKVQAANVDGGWALIVAHIDARLVIERLNLVCPHLWTGEEYHPASNGLMWCSLTIDGITRRDVGEGQGKGLVSDALKRAAVHFGIGVSLYAIPKTFLNAGPHLKPIQTRNGPSFEMTEAGEKECARRYTAWLEQQGKAAFGEPLDHGDADGSVGDPVGAAPAPEAPAPAPADPPPAAGAAERPVLDLEQELTDLLDKRSDLKDRRALADAAMRELGAPVGQRLRELKAASTGRDLDALLARLENAKAAGA